ASPFSVHSAVRHRHLHSFPTRRSSDLIRSMDDRLGHAYHTQKKYLSPPTPRLIYPLLTILFRNQILLINLFLPLNLFLMYPLPRSEEHTSELQSRFDLVCRLLLENKNN